MEFEEWWRKVTEGVDVEHGLIGPRVRDVTKACWQAATERAAGIFEDILTIVDDNCYCKDWDKEMCPYCGIEDVINAQRIVKQALKQEKE
jgi:hypothetical protein